MTRVCAAAGSAVIVGTGTNNTRTTVAATEALAGLPGVVGALVVVPYYVRPSEPAIVAHLQHGRGDEPGADRRLQHPGANGPRARRRRRCSSSRDTPNIAGVKQAVPTLDLDTLEVLAGVPAGFSVLGGEDTLLFPLVCMGASGHDLGRRASVHRAVRRDDRMRSGRQDRRRPRPRRGACCPSSRRRTSSRTPRSSRACCTPRAGSRRPTCGCRSKTAPPKRSNAASRRQPGPPGRRLGPWPDRCSNATPRRLPKTRVA